MDVVLLKVAVAQLFGQDLPGDTRDGSEMGRRVPVMDASEPGSIDEFDRRSAFQPVFSMLSVQKQLPSSS